MRLFQLAVVCAAVVVATAGQLEAGLITFNDRSTFNAEGTIVFNSNFDDFSSSFSFPGDPFTRGDVTYVNTQNLITGTSTGFDPLRNLLTNNYWSPVNATIEASSSQYDLLGFDIGVLNRQDRITIGVTTNLAAYSFPLLNIAHGTQALEFRGFATTTPGEYFTSFSLTTEFGSGSLPGITDVAVGQQIDVAAVPEPASLAIWGIGAMGCALFARRRKMLTA